MRYLAGLVALALTACGHVVTLYPRGGGEQATGTLNDGSRTLSLTVKATTYSGSYALGQTFGFGFGQTFGAAPKFGSGFMVGNNNQATALLVSSDGGSVLRCEFTIVAAMGGNGMCIDRDNVTYDMHIKRQ
jgi:hypothetical protein